MTQPGLYDPVTGLPGRDLVVDRLTVALRGMERTHDATALVLVELDPLDEPQQPDRPDQPTGPLSAGDGDQVIREVAQRLCGAVRAFDSVGRIGPTTFAVIFQGQVSEERLRLLARRILFELSPPVQLDDRQYFVLARLGGTFAQPGGDRPESVVERARGALADARASASEVFVLRSASPDGADHSGADWDDWADWGD